MTRSKVSATALIVLLAVGTSANAAAPKVGEAATDFTLNTPAGEPVQLTTLLKQGPVVLVVLRGWPGYQCPICTVQVAELVGKSKDFDAAKAQVVLVYPGPATGLDNHAKEFATGRNLPASFHYVTDPDYVFTKQYNLRWNAPNETAYPSTFVIDAQGKIVFAKTSRGHGDRAKAADVVRALKASK